MTDRNLVSSPADLERHRLPLAVLLLAALAAVNVASTALSLVAGGLR